jgi:hypothetical protein
MYVYPNLLTFESLMKPVIIIFFAALATAFSACGSQHSPSSENNESGATATTVYEGSIGDNLEVVLWFGGADDKLEGSYFYRKVGTDIRLTGEMRGDSIHLEETDAKGKKTGEFTGIVSSDKFTGRWSAPGNAKRLSFAMKKSDNPARSKMRVKYHYLLATSKEAMDDWDGKPEKYVRGFVYPELAGLDNGEMQDQINQQLYPDEIDELKKSGDYEPIREITETKYEAFEFPHAHEVIQVSVENFDELLLTWSESAEWDGGAHPSFGFTGYHTIVLATGKQLTIGETLEGKWKDMLLDAAEDVESPAEPGDFEDAACGHIGDTLVANIRGWNGDQPLYVVKDKVVFVAADYRYFGCPEVMRGTFDVGFSYAEMKRFIKPGSVLDEEMKRQKK